MKEDTANHPMLAWTVCFLWLISSFAIVISLLLFYFVGDILICTGTDIINAFVLLSGIIMLPTNLYMIYSIAENRKIRHKSKVVFCPLWMCIVWIIIINFIGAVLGVRRISNGEKLIRSRIMQSMANYRTGHLHKRIMDNVQWTLQCCGLNSYRDWFSRDWYDKSRDYEWEPSLHKRHEKFTELTDSVPLSCCKSGSCISNYLSELGTYSINTHGCSRSILRVIKAYIIIQIVGFVLVILMELFILIFVYKKSNPRQCNGSEDMVQFLKTYNIRQIMEVKKNFRPSSESHQVAADETEEES